MSNRLYVGNLPFSATTEALRAAFAPSGDVTDVHIVTDRESGQSRGWRRRWRPRGWWKLRQAQQQVVSLSARRQVLPGASPSLRRFVAQP